MQCVECLHDVMRCIRSQTSNCLSFVCWAASLTHTQTRSACSAACMLHHVAQNAVTSLDFDSLLEKQQIPTPSGKSMLQVLRCVQASLDYSDIARLGSLAMYCAGAAHPADPPSSFSVAPRRRLWHSAPLLCH